jgi:molybdopterin-containing oxidoreductase family iron-sulfur binding subunit
MPPLIPPGLTRREALQALAASVALATAGCSKPDEEIVPAVRPTGSPVGDPLRFATCLPLAGYARGVVGISIDGRPIKIEGNDRHPASLGATDVFAEAEILTLYDPDRSRTVRQDRLIATWDAFLSGYESWRTASTPGKSLRLLTGRVTSPTLLRQIVALLAALPGSAWHAYEATEDAGRAGSRLAFGRELEAIPQLDRAEVVLCLDADPLGPGPDQIRLARQWASRRTGPARFSRSYVLEALPTLTGAKADERLSAHPTVIRNAAIALANGWGAGLPGPDLPPPVARLVAAAGAALKAAPGRAVVLAGRTLDPETIALVHWINQKLDAPASLAEPADRSPGLEPRGIPELAADLESGRVGALVIAGANPAYDLPQLGLDRHLPGLAFSAHHGLWFDETAELCRWHVPASHALETWSDLRSLDGTPSIAQPLIRPLYDTMGEHALLAVLSGQSGTSDHALVRATWVKGSDGGGEEFWRKALESGVAGPSPPPVADVSARLPAIAPSRAVSGLALVLQPDPCLFDGSRANNAWLQECPTPLGKQVWGNALLLAPEDAERLTLADGDVVVLGSGKASVTAPVVVMPGVAPGVVGLTLGHGRRKAGAIGTGVGTDAYALRGRADAWVVEDIRIERTGGRQDILTAQLKVRLDGKREDLYPVMSLKQAMATPGPERVLPDFYPDRITGGPAWAMVIDTSLCIGCNACVVACQAENNVPVVGPEEVARGRVMHWLRIDVYDHGTPAEPRPGFQPVPCMQCEKAPCEPVCPVAASVHDAEGLNVQVYNRCIGTRFCEANCPYKVRRFNFFGYADGQEYARLGAEPLKAQKNPDVTVRARGVMEKCTYCIQRIARARQEAERDGRGLADLAVTTACQQACPTRAIRFGDLDATDSQVAALRGDLRHYALLGHLNTKPRTTYLADLRNPDPALEERA